MWVQVAEGKEAGRRVRNDTSLKTGLGVPVSYRFLPRPGVSETQHADYQKCLFEVKVARSLQL